MRSIGQIIAGTDVILGIIRGFTLTSQTLRNRYCYAGGSQTRSLRYTRRLSMGIESSQ
jgi:hypothetical protein